MCIRDSVQPASVASRLQLTTTTTTTTTIENNIKQQGGVVVSRNSYMPQKPPPLPVPDNELVKQLRPVQTNETTTKPSPSSSSSSSSSLSSSSATREKQMPVRELVAQLSGRMPSATTTTTSSSSEQQQQQQLRRQQRRQQLQQLHGRPLSSSSSDAEADCEIFINTPPAAAVTRRADTSNEDNSVTYLCYFSYTPRQFSSACTFRLLLSLKPGFHYPS